MRIAIQAADLDHPRIDGTRVYLLNMLRRFGNLSPKDEFLIFHQRDFNPELAPPDFPNYKIVKISSPLFWTQTRFAFEIFKNNPDVLWMPMHNAPLFRRKKLKLITTIHDLAYKYFPDNFPKKDLLELNLLGNWAIKNSDKIIAVSQSTKNDILKFYPKIKTDKIKVIHHGFDADLFQKEISRDKTDNILSKFKILNFPPGRDSAKAVTKFILYVGAIQPRKNLRILIEAFNLYKKGGYEKDLKLVLAGGKAWMWEEIFKSIKKSPHREDIVVTGTIPFEEIAVLYKNARLFVFPSLYEGFGIPLLEAFAAGIPVVSSKNSSLWEVGGEAARYFDSSSSFDLCRKMREVSEDDELRKKLIKKGREQIKKFSWDKCAGETLEYLKY